MAQLPDFYLVSPGRINADQSFELIIGKALKFEFLEELCENVRIRLDRLIFFFIPRFETIQVSDFQYPHHRVLLTGSLLPGVMA